MCLCLNTSTPVWAWITYKRRLGRESTKNHWVTVECIHKAIGEGWQKKIRYWFSKEQKQNKIQLQYHVLCNPNAPALWISHVINCTDMMFEINVRSRKLHDVCILFVHSAGTLNWNPSNPISDIITVRMENSHTSTYNVPQSHLLHNERPAWLLQSPDCAPFVDCCLCFHD